MTGDKLKALRRSARMSPRAFASFVGVDGVTVYRWERHMETNVRMGETTTRVIRELARCKPVERQRLARVAGEWGWRAAWALLFDGTPSGKGAK